ncbi:flavin reductase family protein NDAI_0G01220 [Naumovozyma dairenensis CBS 421]|uniref:Flavin reductase like domain-containing protein n=1 Tax=Naumovozyma dairenensis (strain ATCC 10597 / BCRC 20456 / CBS 421 / NBRC 0211 / NRRL Y-12639) TaxID=1071378 RepID=G0WDN7_NAUDC|nr:hypothetical protein NDAI_0G01220 [Naumovozyma dairenensis CBS 421]CCD25898.2 hypothetical protein NDAI_0G01220 [Naumovozyma dairenensis CBS 421]
MFRNITRSQSTFTTTQLRFKDIMSRISHSVMIITSAVPDTETSSSYHGLTISSMTSLSLNPYPRIQFNLQIPSFTSDALHLYKYFAIHVLKPNEYSINLAKQFSKGSSIRHSNGFERTRPFVGLKEHVDFEKYPLINDKSEKLNIPILSGCERILICKNDHVFEVGDHEIWIGKVEDILDDSVKTDAKNHNNTEQDTKNHTKDDGTEGSLLYYNRRFHIIGGHLA